MKESVQRGSNRGVLPAIEPERKASTYYIRATGYKASLQSRRIGICLRACRK